MSAQIKLSLSAEDKKRLAQNLKSGKTPVRLVERSKIVLLAAMMTAMALISLRQTLEAYEPLPCSAAAIRIEHLREKSPECMFFTEKSPSILDARCRGA